MANTTTALPVWETMTAAWAKVSGTKGSLWGGIIIILLIGLGFAILQAILAHVPVVKPIVGIIAQLVIFLLQAGLIYIGIRRAFDLPFSYDLVFRALDVNIGWRVVAAYILQTIILAIPLVFGVLCHILGTSMNAQWISALGYIISVVVMIYLMVRLILVAPFVIDKVVGPVQAIKLSFQATRDNFWSVLGILILAWVFLIICAIPFGIGLIWGLPFVFVLTGVVYKRLSATVRA